VRHAVDRSIELVDNGRDGIAGLARRERWYSGGVLVRMCGAPLLHRSLRI
jgi:hypothetical protein